MAIPNFLSNTVDGAPQYTKLTALADVETGGVGVITSVRAQLVTALGWTEPSTALFQSPAQSDGTWMDILLTRVDQWHLQIRLRDQNANVIFTRNCILGTGAAGSSDVYIFSGLTRLLIYFGQGTTNKNCGHCWITEPSPGLNADITKRVVGSTRYTSANADSGTTPADFFAWDNGAAATVARVMRRSSEVAGGAVGNTTSRTDQSGRLWFHEAEVALKPVSTTEYFGGRLPNVFLGPANLGGDTLKTLPIDDATTGVFFSLQAAFSAVAASPENWTLWIRKS